MLELHQMPLLHVISWKEARERSVCKLLKYFELMEELLLSAVEYI
jgi:hypothetical protein